MKYHIEYTRTAVRQLKKMDKRIVSFIIAYIEDRLEGCENPRAYGKSLQGNLNDKWRYRIGDYRILAKIEDSRLIIVVVEVGHRKDICK
ncbi:MAG: type II toxin-antitoxin system RelE/ParE family toxin [Clostridiales bacterium]|nr:type II toxin-antitoxin system RelE/ParE family toxin [Clostridiales bacterium]